MMKFELVQKKSSKGNDYIVLQIQLTPNYTKDVFLDKAEIELIKLYAEQHNQSK